MRSKFLRLHVANIDDAQATAESPESSESTARSQVAQEKDEKDYFWPFAKKDFKTFLFCLIINLHPESLFTNINCTHKPSIQSVALITLHYRVQIARQVEKFFAPVAKHEKTDFQTANFFLLFLCVKKKNTIFFVVWGEARDGRVQLCDLQSKTSIISGCSRFRFPRKKIHPLWIPVLHSKIFHPSCENETFWLM